MSAILEAPVTDLPDGWEWRTLADLGDWCGGGTPSKQRSDFWEGGSIPWVSPKDMKSLRLTDTQDHITPAAVEGSAAKLFPANSIALVVRSGILEHTLPVALIPFEATANQDMRVLIPGPEVSSDWALWALLAAREDIRRGCQKDGTTVASIDVGRMQAYQIPVPAPDEQERIVETVEELMTQIAEGERQLRSAIDAANKYRAAVLSRPFSGSYPAARVSEIGDVVLGFTPSRKSPELWDGDVPWVSSGEVAFRRITSTRETVARSALGRRQLNPPGTVLIAMYGEGKTRGQAAILDIEAVTNQAVAAIRVNRERMLPEFLYQCLMHEYATIRAVAQGGQQPNLNGELVKAIEVPAPPLADQRAFVESAEAHLAEADRLESSIRAALFNVQGLKRAVLRDALTGSLTSEART